MENTLKMFRALADPTRLRIVSLLLRRDLCVCELMFILKMEQSRISHQLRILRDADLVEDIREGRWMTYRISDSARPNLEVIFSQIPKEQIRDSRDLEICLRENVRRRRSSSRQQAGEKI